MSLKHHIKEERFTEDDRPMSFSVKRRISEINKQTKHSSSTSFKMKEVEDCAGKQIFRKKWLELPEFKGWLMEGLLPYHGHCSICQINITAGKSELVAHSRSKKHIRNKRAERTQIDPEVTAVVDDTGSTHLLHVIDLRNDSLSTPTKEMKKAMIDVEAGDTSFNSDNAVKECEEFVAKMLGKEAGLFFPTHLMANLVGVLTHCQCRGSAVIAGDKSDIFINNQESLIKFGGLHFRKICDEADGSFCLEDFEDALKKLDNNFPLSNLVCFECSHNRMGGRVPPLNWIDQVGLLCDTYNVNLHCDGTRLINASLVIQLPPSRLVQYCDSVTLALDKGLGSPLGAVLVGTKEFINSASFIRKFIGGDIHQAGIFAAAGTYALEHNIQSLYSDHKTAKAIAIAVARGNSRHIKVNVNNVQTNIVHIHTKTDLVNASQLAERLTTVTVEESKEFPGQNIVILGDLLDETTLSFMTYSNLKDNDIRAVINKLSYIMKEYDEL